MTEHEKQAAVEADSGKTKLAWMSHAFFWLCICGGGIAGSWLTERALYFDGIPPVPLRANPRLLSISIFGIPVVLAALWWVSRLTGKQNLAFPLATLLVCLCLVGIVASVSPGPGSLASREIIQVSSVAPRQNTFAYPIYFDNDRFEITRGEISRIVDALTVFRTCEAGTLGVRGFASSAEYQPDRDKSDEYNKNLANKRAIVVRDLIKKVSGIEAAAKDWATYDDMVAQRRVRDVGLNGERLLPIEKLNRRVEVFWSDSRCSDGERIAQLPAKL